MGRAFFLQLPRRSDRDDDSVIDDRDAIAEALRFLDVMRGHQNRALLCAQLLDQVANLEAHLRIKAGRRFVEEKHLRVVDQRESKREALLLSAGKGGVSGLALFPKLQPAQERVAIDPFRIEGTKEFERFVHLDLVGQIRGLQTNTDPILQRLLLPIGIKAEDLHFAATARTQAFEDFHRGGLTGAIRPEQTENFAGAHLKIDALHRLD